MCPAFGVPVSGLRTAGGSVALVTEAGRAQWRMRASSLHHTSTRLAHHCLIGLAGSVREGT